MSIFEQVGKSQFVVPGNYAHQSEIDFATRVAKESGTLEMWEKGLTSANFTLVSSRLFRNRTYSAQIIQVNQHVSSERCLRFLAEQNALLVGAQGLTLVHRLNSELFHSDKFVFSLDIKTALWADGTIYRMPFVCNFPRHGWRFGLGDFKDGLDKGDCVLCVTVAR